MRGELQITIELGNAAMSTRDHVQEALARTAVDVQQAGERAGLIRDVNGNTVGSWEFAVVND